jgi:hypothetical protein
MMIRESQAEDLALITCVIIKEELIGGTVWQDFTIAYELAKEFQKVYPADHDWQDEDVDFESAIVMFVKIHRVNALQNKFGNYKQSY